MDRSPAQAASQRDLVGEVSRILFEADVIGIGLGSNTDEYDPEAEAIVAQRLPAMVGERAARAA